MKKMLSRTLLGCAALAVVGGVLAAPSLAAERTLARSTAVQTTSASAAITEDEARTIALTQANLTVGKTTWISSGRDYDDGRLEYEVEFSADGWKYEVTVDASTGAVTAYEQKQTQYSYPQDSTDIGAEKAQSAALAHAGVSAADAAFIKTELDRDDGVRVYEVKFFVNSTEYEYKIDAADGTVLRYEYEVKSYSVSSSASDYIGEAAAKQIVEEAAGTTGVYTEFKLDEDDGRVVYEGELRSGRTEYEFKVDALTGAILDWDVDWD